MYENQEWEQGTVVSPISFVNKVYGIMALGLFVTAAVAYYTAITVMPDTVAQLYTPAVIFEFLLVLALSFFVTKMPGIIAFMAFLLYAAVNGFTLSVLLYVYSQTAIMKAFLVTGGTFGAMTLYGTVTRSDLTKLGALCFMALLGIIIASIVNFFLNSSAFDLFVSILGLLVFVGLTAYDAQKIKRLAEAGAESSGLAVAGALQLYLDFINLFLYILRLFGGRRK